MNIHFIGIGGIGVSALAKYYLKKGKKVSGSDLNSSEITESLKNEGAEIFIGNHKTENISKRVDLVIYSPAIKGDNPEIQKAKERGIKIQSYPENLGELTKQYFTIAVSGTHGKSTTTAMASLILIKAGLDPTVIVGTKLKEFKNSNLRMGNSKYLLIEADEWNASFLNYQPDIIVLNNIELEHLDYYKDINHILKTYKEYISHLKEGGVLIVNNEDKNIRDILPEEGNIRKFIPEEIKLKVPGKHNISNATAALFIARELDIPEDTAREALLEYKGTWRRFEEKETESGLVVISDYGHHPTEVKVTLDAVREKYPNQRIFCVFQPHQYQRTYFLLENFIDTFRQAPINDIIITDIYDVAGRERADIKDKITAEKMVDKIKKENVVYKPKEEIISYLKNHLKKGDILVIMGAGDIYKLAEEFSTS